MQMLKLLAEGVMEFPHQGIDITQLSSHDVPVEEAEVSPKTPGGKKIKHTPRGGSERGAGVIATIII